MLHQHVVVIRLEISLSRHRGVSGHDLGLGVGHIQIGLRARDPLVPSMLPPSAMLGITVGAARVADRHHIGVGEVYDRIRIRMRFDMNDLRGCTAADADRGLVGINLFGKCFGLGDAGGTWPLLPGGGLARRVLQVLVCPT